MRECAKAKILAPAQLACGLLALLASIVPPVCKGQVLNGFELADARVPADEIMRGGPPRDGIPAIDRPRFILPGEAAWLAADARVIGVHYEGIARAYPISILNWHEIVNDSFAGTPVLVTFCPLCGTGIVFLPEGADADFGVSGLLYNSDVLLYDRKTESLWSQILAEAISGERRGEQLRILPALHTTWGQWQAQHPDSVVLSRETGHRRNYEHDPYAGYADNPATFFPVSASPDDSLHPKERVLGLRVGAQSKAYPFSYLKELGKRELADVVGGQQVTIHWDASAPTAWATDALGDQLAATDSFWFAWFAFFPETELMARP